MFLSILILVSENQHISQQIQCLQFVTEYLIFNYLFRSYNINHDTHDIVA